MFAAIVNFIYFGGYIAPFAVQSDLIFFGSLIAALAIAATVLAFVRFTDRRAPQMR